MSGNLLLIIAIFLLVFILILIRPKGLNEAWFTVGGGIAMLPLGLETPKQALEIVLAGKDALLFLFGLLLLADLMKISGFFEWAAIHAARSAKGNGKRLFLNVFLLGAAVTALLSLDTTAVMLTPVVLAFVGRLKLPAKPFLFACAFVANTGSLLLTVSNLTNLLFAGAFGWSFLKFSAVMVLPQIFALGANIFLFKWIFNRELPPHFEQSDLPNPEQVIPDPRFFRASIAIFLLVVLGYFVGSAVHVPPYAFAISGAVILFGFGLGLKRVQIKFARQVSWSVFPFVIGLFVIVRAIETLGVSDIIQRAFEASSPSELLTVLTGTFGAGLGSNVVNNIPMSLLSISSLNHGSDLARYSALIGCNIGPNITVAGSLATMLVITTARKGGEDVGAKDFFKIGIWVTPILLLAASAGLLVASEILVIKS